MPEPEVTVTFPGLASWPSRNVSDLVHAFAANRIALTDHDGQVRAALDYDTDAGTFTLIDATGQTPLQRSQYVVDTVAADSDAAGLAMLRQRGYTRAAEAVALEAAAVIELHHRT